VRPPALKQRRCQPSAAGPRSCTRRAPSSTCPPWCRDCTTQALGLNPATSSAEHHARTTPHHPAAGLLPRADYHSKGGGRQVHVEGPAAALDANPPRPGHCVGRERPGHGVSRSSALLLPPAPRAPHALLARGGKSKGLGLDAMGLHFTPPSCLRWVAQPWLSRPGPLPDN